MIFNLVGSRVGQIPHFGLSYPRVGGNSHLVTAVGPGCNCYFLLCRTIRKFRLDPNAKEFNPNAKEFVPSVSLSSSLNAQSSSVSLY